MKNQQGFILPLTLMVLLLLTALGLTLVGLGMTQIAIATNWRDYTRSLYAAEAGTEAGLVSLRDLLAGEAAPNQADLDTIQPPTLSDSRLVFSAYTVAVLVPDHPCPPPDGCVTGPGRWSGNSAEVTVYVITATVTGPGGVKATVQQEVNWIHNHSNGHAAVVTRGRWSQL